MPFLEKRENLVSWASLFFVCAATYPASRRVYHGSISSLHSINLHQLRQYNASQRYDFRSWGSFGIEANSSEGRGVKWLTNSRFSLRTLFPHHRAQHSHIQLK